MRQVIFEPTGFFRPTNRPQFVSFASLSQHREPHSPARRRHARAPFQAPGARGHGQPLDVVAQPLGMRSGFVVQKRAK